MQLENILPTNSQKKTILFYFNKTDKFNNILSMTQSTNCVITVETEDNVYKIGRLGGLKSYIKKANY
jgi:hypothetical protein